MASLDRFGEENYINRVRKFARVQGLTGTGIVWDGAVAPISQPEYQGWLDTEDSIKAISDNLADAPGGTGAYRLYIVGQGSDGIEKTSFIDINGTTEVSFPVNDKYEIIYRAWIVNIEAIANGNQSPVTNPANAGLIKIYPASAPTRIMAAILPGKGQTQMAVWRCPKNKYGEFKKLGIYPNAVQGITVRLFTRPNKNTSWRSLGSIDEEGFVTEPNWPKGLEEYIAPGTDLTLVANCQTAANISSILWVKLFDIPNYDELLLEEQAGV